MPKTQAEMARESIARKRQRARAAGLCYTCCKNVPNQGRVVCLQCNEAVRDRKRQKRQRDREAAKLQQVVAIQERAGDEASAYHLYGDATHYYQEALNVPGLGLSDRERIAAKIGQAFLLNGELKPAHLWFERLLTVYRSNLKGATKSVETLFQIYRELTWDCKGEAAFATMMHAVQIAEMSGDTRLSKLTQLRRVEALQQFGRFDEAAQVLGRVGHISEDNDALLRCYYFVAHGRAEGAAGNADSAYENFEYALELTKKDLDPYLVTVVGLRYGHIAQELGDTMRAKACFEQALFVAQENRIIWVISRIRLYYAQLLAYMGQSATAYSHLTEALSSSPSIPFLEVHRAFIGIPLALQFHDEAALAQCAHPKAIDLAFQSETSDVIGGIANAFAQLHIFQGRPRAARPLLHRALKSISDARLNLDVLIAVARYGALVDIPRARSLIEARTALPHAAVFRAGLALFDAYVDRRKGALAQARKHARDAASRFETLQWHGYAEMAHSIVPNAKDAASRKPVENAPFSDMQPALTAREREVAALVLRGFTNRQIASDLTIALHTVEKHMNSIMNRLGVRSRYQVADLLETTLD